MTRFSFRLIAFFCRFSFVHPIPSIAQNACIPPRPWAGTVGMPTASPSTRPTSKANAKVLAGYPAVRMAVCGDRRGLVHATLRPITVEEQEIYMERKRHPDPAPEPLSVSADGAGFKPLADWVHAQGLKFGIHIVRGIPRQVVEAKPAHRRIRLSRRTMRPTPPAPAPGTTATGA